MLHQYENNPDTESFLKENGKKFSQDCIIAMKLMYEGVRLNGDTCKQLFGIHDRRLRECREARPDIVKSEWKRNAQGKRICVEFWIEKIAPPTKQSVQEWWSEHQNEQPAKVIPMNSQPKLF